MRAVRKRSHQSHSMACTRVTPFIHAMSASLVFGPTQNVARGQSRGNQYAGTCASSIAHTNSPSTNAVGARCGWKIAMFGSSLACQSVGSLIRGSLRRGIIAFASVDRVADLVFSDARAQRQIVLKATRPERETAVPAGSTEHEQRCEDEHDDEDDDPFHRTERVSGVEPELQRWERRLLPLQHTRGSRPNSSEPIAQERTFRRRAAARASSSRIAPPYAAGGNWRIGHRT